MVHRHERQAVPRAFLDRDLRAEGLDEVVALRRGEAAELDVGALPADGRYLGRRRGDEYGPVPVEIGLALVPVVGILPPHEVRAFHVLDKLERAGAHRVRLVPVYVLGENVRLVDEVEGRGHVDQERGLGPLEPEPHRLRVGRLDGLDHLVGPLASGDHAGRRKNDLVIACLDVARRHGAAVVKPDALAQLEGVGHGVRRNRPGLGQVGYRPRPGSVGGIDAQEGVVDGREGVDGAEGSLAVSVIGRRLRGNQEDQLSTVAGLFLRGGLRGRHSAGQDNERQSEHAKKPQGTDHGAPPDETLRSNALSGEQDLRGS